ncbi:Bro-N domain-containing protein [Paludibacteraceae bacterium OttesenSCG-928-F17]|nr:Bro-N domain-containing protein [Paludibacteraceae bacterium OttesenSCG-928-F17]
MRKMQLQVSEGLEVQVIPNIPYEFLMPTEDVAKGYGVQAGTIRKHKKENADELIEGEHFLIHSFPSVTKSNARSKRAGSDNLQSKQVFWTKAGVIRLGFFIKSQQAKQFRNWAEKLILEVSNHNQRQQQQAMPAYEPPRYIPENNRQLGKDLQMLIYRELLKVDSRPVRNKIAALVDFYVTQIN